jgi:hypothetical protein
MTQGLYNAVQRTSNVIAAVAHGLHGWTLILFLFILRHPRHTAPVVGVGVCERERNVVVLVRLQPLELFRRRLELDERLSQSALHLLEFSGSRSAYTWGRTN